MSADNELEYKNEFQNISGLEKQRIPISQVFSVFVAVIILFSESKWAEISNTMAAVLFAAGVLLVGIASFGRLWCSLYIAGYKTDTLITDGPYSMSRNPLYFFSLLGGIGVGLTTETIVIPLMILLAFSSYYPSVIKSEEVQLLLIHGKMYEKYKEATPSFFPKIQKLKEPGEYIAKPEIFRDHMYSAIWFIWLIGLIHAVESLRASGILPGMLTLY